MPILLPILIFIVCIIGIFAFIIWFKHHGWRKRIAYVKEGKSGTNPQGAEEILSLRKRNGSGNSSIISALDQRVPFVVRVQNRLERSGKDITVARYVSISGMLGIFVALLVIFLTDKPPVLGLLVGIIVGVGFPHIYIGHHIRKRMKQFLTLFPDAIDLIVRGLRSGLPVGESINTISEEIPAPVGDTFDTISDAVKLGVPLEQALLDMAMKLQMSEFNFFCTSIILQRETGGNLAEILANLSEVLRSRFMMRMKIRAMSSEARASAMIISALPFVVILAVYFTSPDYISLLFTDSRGNIAGLAAMFSMGTGITIMAKMSRFEI